MKLVYPELDIKVQFSEGITEVLAIENRHAFSGFLGALWNQYEGRESGIVISDGEKILSIKKDADVIFNPYDLNVNNRKILSRLYKEIADIANESFVEESAVINSQMLDYVDILIDTLPYCLNMQDGISIEELLKLYNVHFDVDAASLEEKILDYMSIMHKACGTSLFVFVNLKDYLDQEELMKMYEGALLEKVHILIVEGGYNVINKTERCLIIDRDLCTIQV